MIPTPKNKHPESQNGRLVPVPRRARRGTRKGKTKNKVGTAPTLRSLEHLTKRASIGYFPAFALGCVTDKSPKISLFSRPNSHINSHSSPPYLPS